MISCTLCEKPSRKTGAAGIYLTRGGCRSPWQLCPECSQNFQQANDAERGELLMLIEATLTDGESCE